jgi:chitinase
LPSIFGLIDTDIALLPFFSCYLRVDLDIEQGVSTGYAAFVNRLREHATHGTKQLYVTAAPQCPFPDAYIGQALNAAPFDAVYVQFCTFLLFVLPPG